MPQTDTRHWRDWMRHLAQAVSARLTTWPIAPGWTGPAAGCASTLAHCGRRRRNATLSGEPGINGHLRRNVARRLKRQFPALSLNAPTSSLGRRHRDVVMGVIEKAKRNTVAIMGILLGIAARERVWARETDVTVFTPSGALQ